MVLKYGFFIMILLNLMTTIDSNVVSMSGKLPPGSEYREVSLQLRIMHIYDINLDHQTVRLSGYFRQSWNDSRMMGNQWDGVTPSGRRFFLMNKAEALWYPDTFISNSIDHQDRQSFSGDPQGAYHYFRVYTDGEVLYSQMIDIMIKTKMNLKYYPFNVLNISLDVESYGYPDHTLRYAPGSSSDTDGLIIKIQNVPGYEINESLAKSYLTTAEYSTGNFSKIEMSFTLIPNDSTLFILCIPNLLLIVISSFVFWMDVKKKLSERLSLGITAMLADFALSFSLPVPVTPDFLYVREYINISYIFIGFSIFFTFTEYVVVSFIYNVKVHNTLSPKNSIRRRRKIKMPNSLISRSVKNLKNDFSKLLNLNELMRDSLIDYSNNSMPEEPVMPIKAALGVFYLLCWVTFMIGHIIPGKIIMDKARRGINYHSEAVQYFPTTMSVGIAISIISAAFAYYLQNKSRNAWSKKIDNHEKHISSGSSTIRSEPSTNQNTPYEIAEDSISKLSNNIAGGIVAGFENKKKEIDNYDIDVLDKKIKDITESINNDFKEMSECINKTLHLHDNSSDDNSNVIITVVDK